MSKDFGPSSRNHLRGIGGEKAQRYLRRYRYVVKRKHRVKRIRGGINDGKYGVYWRSTLKMTFKTKGAAKADANRRDRDEGRV